MKETNPDISIVIVNTGLFLTPKRQDHIGLKQKNYNSQFYAVFRQHNITMEHREVESKNTGRDISGTYWPDVQEKGISDSERTHSREDQY